MSLCSYEKCPHYSRATKYDRACYHGEPQCWKGWLDLIGFTLWLGTFGRSRLRKKSEKSQEGFKDET